MNFLSKIFFWHGLESISYKLIYHKLFHVSSFFNYRNIIYKIPFVKVLFIPYDSYCFVYTKSPLLEVVIV